jgi:hypothetical protein
MRLFTIDAGYKYDSYRIGPRHLLFDMNQGRISEAETDRGEVPK